MWIILGHLLKHRIAVKHVSQHFWIFHHLLSHHPHLRILHHLLHLGMVHVGHSHSRHIHSWHSHSWHSHSRHSHSHHILKRIWGSLLGLLLGGLLRCLLIGLSGLLLLLGFCMNHMEIRLIFNFQIWKSIVIFFKNFPFENEFDFPCRNLFDFFNLLFKLNHSGLVINFYFKRVF